MYLPHDAQCKDTIKTSIASHLNDMQKAELTTTASVLEVMQVVENSAYPVHSELYDEHFTSTTQVIPSQLNTCPYSLNLTFSIFNTASYGLFLLASRQTGMDGNHPGSPHITI